MIILLILLCLIVITLIFSGIVFRLSMMRGRQKLLPTRFRKQNRLPFRLDTSWLKKSAYQDVYLNSADGLKLHAYLINNGCSRWAVICHSYTANAKCMSPFGEKYTAMGYNVLLIDSRAHGLSEGRYIAMGWQERKDLLLWLAYLQEHYPNQPIIMHGISMGASTIMWCCGSENFPQQVKAVVEDCGYSSVWREMKALFKTHYHLPAFPVLYGASLWNRCFNGYWLKSEGEITPVLTKSRVPMLFIHGAADRFVPLEMVEELYAAAVTDKEKLIVPGADHGKASVIAPDLYWQTVQGFLDKYLSV